METTTTVRAEVARAKPHTPCVRTAPLLGVRDAALSRLDWGALQELARRAPLADGYRFALLERAEIPDAIALIVRWFPEISVGSASGYLDEAFYQRRVWFADARQPGDVVVLTLRHGDALVGVFSCDIDPFALALHARIGVALPAHRGARLAQAGMAFSEAAGRWLGMGIVYGMATLKAPHAQRAFERAGWRLVGIVPGLDREMVADGVVKRVYEAMYAKTLVADDGLLSPQPHNMTSRTHEVFGRLFGCAAHSPAANDDACGEGAH